MSNMPHCIFENTLSDLSECLAALEEGVDLDGMSEYERPCVSGLVEKCREVYEKFTYLIEE